MYDLIMFDLDGTLVDTAPEIADAVNALLAEEGLPALDEPTVAAGIGLGKRHLLRHALAASAGAGSADPGVTEARLARFSQHYRAHSGRRSRPYPGARETLLDLRARGARLALVTNKEQRFTDPVLDAHGLRAQFDLVLCGDSLPAHKPDPLPLRHCMAHLDAAPERALFVGDSQTDVDAARNAGVAVWAVAFGYNGNRPIEDARPDRVLPSYRALREALALQAAAAAAPGS